MKVKLIVLSITCFLFKAINAQNLQIDLLGGASASHIGFKGFNEFVESYNSQNANILKSKLNHKPLGFGYQVGMGIQYSIMFMNFTYLTTSTVPAVAEFNNGEKRVYQFKTKTLDIPFGFTIGKPQKTNIQPYFAMAFHNTNLTSYFQYTNGFKSYGNDTRYSGVWTSWKFPLKYGVRILQPIGKASLYLDFNSMFNSKTYLGGSFDESNSATDSRYFVKISTQADVDAITDGLKEIYNTRSLSIGLTLPLFKTEID